MLVVWDVVGAKITGARNVDSRLFKYIYVINLNSIFYPSQEKRKDWESWAMSFLHIPPPQQINLTRLHKRSHLKRPLLQ